MGRLYKTVKQNPLLNLKPFQKDNGDRVDNLSTLSGSAATAKAIAEQVGVNEKTVRRAEKFADAVETLQQISPQAAERVLRGEVRDALTELPKVPKEALSFVAEKIEEGARSIKLSANFVTLTRCSFGLTAINLAGAISRTSNEPLSCIGFTAA